MKSPLQILLVTLLVLASAAPVAAGGGPSHRYLATAEDFALAFTAKQLVGNPEPLLVVAEPARGSLDVTNGGLDFLYTPDPGFVGVDWFQLHWPGNAEQPPTDLDVVVSVAPALIPLAGDWNGDGITEVGLYDSGDVRLYLYQENETYPPRFDYTYAGAGSGWRPFAGDFDQDGSDEVGLYDPSTGNFHRLLLPVDPVPPEQGFNELLPFDELAGTPLGAGELPVAGDWSDVGQDDLGVFVPPVSLFYLWKGLQEVGTFGVPIALQAPGTEPVTGDWNDDGDETVGLYDPATGHFNLRNQPGGGPADDVRIVLGVAGLERLPVTGNWFGEPGGDPEISVGLFDPAALTITLYVAAPEWLTPVVEIQVDPSPPCNPPFDICG